jgi:hypothetical protein
MTKKDISEILEDMPRLKNTVPSKEEWKEARESYFAAKKTGNMEGMFNSLRKSMDMAINCLSTCNSGRIEMVSLLAKETPNVVDKLLSLQTGESLKQACILADRYHLFFAHSRENGNDCAYIH